MFAKDLLVSLNSLLSPKVRYLGTKENNLSPEAWKNTYQLVATNLELAKKEILKLWNLIKSSGREAQSCFKITQVMCGILSTHVTKELWLS